MRWLGAIAFAGACIALLACADSPVGPARGVGESAIRYHREDWSDPVVKVHILEVDLADPSVRVVVTSGGADPDGDGPCTTTLRTVRQMADDAGLVAAINGNFFACKDKKEFLGQTNKYPPEGWAVPEGPAMSDGRIFGYGAPNAALVVDGAGKVTIGQFKSLPADARQVVSGNQVLVREGKNVAWAQKELAPRTAVGINAAGTRLFMLVADGRRTEYSVGLTYSQVADTLVKLGCQSAISLDGGGSSTMVMGGAAGKCEVVNRPSDGSTLVVPLSVERPVACGLGIKIVGPTSQPSR